MKTWGLRVAGWALMFLGIILTTRILYTLGKHLLLWQANPKISYLFEDQIIDLPFGFLHSGLAPCCQRASFLGAETLCLLHLLLALPSHHCKWLAFLSALSSLGSGSCGSPSSAHWPGSCSSQEERMTFRRMCFVRFSFCILVKKIGFVVLWC